MNRKYKVTIRSINAVTYCKDGIELDRLIEELLRIFRYDNISIELAE